MTIPESQFETWSRPGASATAKATHESIRRALAAETSLIKGRDVEVYLQGSYKNDTNIRGDSDVDVVVQLNSTFQSDLSVLPEASRVLQRQSYATATYQWADFRRDVLRVLQAHFGAANVSEGDKAVKVNGGSGRLPADVVVCLQYRKYKWFLSPEAEGYIEGMVFYTREGRPVINFPKAHYENGVAKNSSSSTHGWYKPTVRLFKNARTHLVDHGQVSESLVPSYFLECLLSNVPDNLFGGTFAQTFFRTVGWLNHTDMSTFMCQNGQCRLFGQAILGSTPEQWWVSDAKTFLAQLANLWTHWR